MDTDDTYDWKGNMNPIYALIHTNSLEAENKLVAFQREVEALRREQENTLTEMEKESTLDDRFLGELKDQDIEICKLQDYVNQLQKENSEAKMLLEEQEKKHNITMDAFKQELHANSLDAVNQLAAIQREVAALQNELEYTVAEMEKKQRCLDEFMDKDLEVGKLQDYVHQLQRENREAKMLLAKQEKNHTITVDAIKQETNNKLVATQRQVEALKTELANTVIEMDEKQRCLDEQKLKNNLAQELLEDQKRIHKISMDGIKEKVEFLNKKIEERKADKKQQANQDDLQDIAEAQGKLLHNRAEERLTAHPKSSDLDMDNLKDELEKLKTELNLKNQQLHANSLEADNKLMTTQSQVEALKNELKGTVTEMAKRMKDKDLEVELLTKKLEKNKADKKQQANQDGYQDYKDIAEAQQRLLQERDEEISGVHELMNHYVARLQSAEEKLVLADKKLLAVLSKAEVQEKELMQTRKETSQQLRCLDDLKEKDLQVCELQERVKQLKQQRNFAEELLDDQKRHHKISMDAIKEKVELLTKKLEENKAVKKQQANQDGLLDYKDIAEAQQRLLQERAEEISGIHELMNHYVARLQSAEEKLVLADKKLVAALSKAEALEKEFMLTQKEASQQRSKYHDQIYKLRDKFSDTKDQQKRAIEWRDDQIKDLQRQASFLTRKLEKLTETTEMMDKVNTELLREKRQFYRNLNGDFLV